ncbi:MAG: hypothetical protein DBX47_00015 [Clostridiales bacterium]|nr:MAG: hypothetical protein DBX47_00015 [Clostridiales bacterium]
MFKFTADVSANEYLDWLETLPHYNVMQTPMWAKVKNNWQSSFCLIYENEKPVGGAVLLIRKLAPGFKLIYSPRGFVLDYSNKELVKAFTDGVYAYAKKIGAYMVRIDPEICISTIYKKEKTPVENGIEQMEELKRLGFLHMGFATDFQTYTQPRFNAEYYLLDDNGEKKTDDQILTSFDKKMKKFIGDFTRKRGISFEIKSAKEAIDEFMEMSEHTENRQHILLRNKEYFERMYDAFKGNNYFLFARMNMNEFFKFLDSGEDGDHTEVDRAAAEKIRAEKGNIVTMSAMNVLTSNDTLYLMYSGFDDSVFSRFRSTNQIRYEAMKYFRDKGIKTMSFMGIHGDFNDSLSEFKLKFRPTVVEYAGEFELPVSQWKYKFMNRFFPIAKKAYINVALMLHGKKG